MAKQAEEKAERQRFDTQFEQQALLRAATDREPTAARDQVRLLSSLPRSVRFGPAHALGEAALAASRLAPPGSEPSAIPPLKPAMFRPVATAGACGAWMCDSPITRACRNRCSRDGPERAAGCPVKGLQLTGAGAGVRSSWSRARACRCPIPKRTKRFIGSPSPRRRSGISTDLHGGGDLLGYRGGAGGSQ